MYTIHFYHYNNTNNTYNDITIHRISFLTMKIDIIDIYTI